MSALTALAVTLAEKVSSSASLSLGVAARENLIEAGPRMSVSLRSPVLKASARAMGNLSMSRRAL